jgi:hypothetical protein
MDDMRMKMKEFSDKFCEQDHRTKDTETIWNEFKDALVKSADKHIPRKKITSRWNLPWICCLCAPILMLAMTISWSLIPGSI